MSFSSTYIFGAGRLRRPIFVCAGLTELRNANLGEKGRYYTGFFQMAIGVERMAKLALILDHMASHSLAAPGQQAIRSFGDDLVTLFSKVAAAARARGYVFSGRFSLSSPAKQILEFLSEFAKLRVGQGRTTANVPDMSELYAFLSRRSKHGLRKKRARRRG